MTDKMTIENVGQPGKTYRVDAEKFLAMRAAVLAVLPITAGSVPGGRDGGLVGEVGAAGSGGQGRDQARAEVSGTAVGGLRDRAG